MFEKLAARAVLATTFVFCTLAAPSALAARQAVCEHPEGSRCTAKKDTGRIVCECLDGEQELRNPDLGGADEQELMDACWDAWSATCAPWKAIATCEEPDVGSCEVDGEAGTALCDCIDGGEVEHDVDSLVGLDADGLEDACYVQLDRLCAPQPEPTMAPAPVPEIDDEPEAASCSVDPQGGSPWMLALLLGVPALRRRLRRPTAR